MLIALSVKNKLGFIDGSLPKPDMSDISLLNAWIRNNNVVISWILNFISKEICVSLYFLIVLLTYGSISKIDSNNQMDLEYLSYVELCLTCIKTKVQSVCTLLSSKPYGKSLLTIVLYVHMATALVVA